MGERYYRKQRHIILTLCKQALGVNKQCPNVACRNELGRLSLKELADLNVLKFWIHLENQPGDSIAKQCLKISQRNLLTKIRSALYKKKTTFVQHQI